jgi:ribosomal protein L1
VDELTSSREARILAVAQLTSEAQALGEAALVSDWDEARFRSLRINALAFDIGSQRVAQVVRDLARALGPAGTTPSPGYGAKISFLSDTIGRLLDS